MRQDDLPPELFKILPGALGSLVALGWITGTLLQRVASIFGGSIGAFYATPYLTSAAGTDAGLTGFLVGLFGMAIVSKCYEALYAFNLTGRLDKILSKWGL